MMVMALGWTRTCALPSYERGREREREREYFTLRVSERSTHWTVHEGFHTANHCIVEGTVPAEVSTPHSTSETTQRIKL